MTTVDGSRTYSTHEAARLAGVTYRQAQHWAHRGSLGDHLIGKGSGHHLRWAAVDVVVLCSVAAYARVIRGMADVRDTSGILAAVPSIAEAVRADPHAEWLVVTPDRTASAHRLLSDAIAAVSLRGGLLVDLGAPA